MITREHKRKWVLRVAAIFFGLLPVLVAELGMRVVGLPRTRPAADPFVDLHNLRPLFQVSAADPSRVEIAPSRLNLFRPASFQRVKSKQTFRIFALGGSTTQGEPYSTETAFPAWMGVCFEIANPGRPIEVINCGGLSYASYRVLAILKEVINYEPDLIVVYSGHNEFLERRSYAGLDIDSLQARSMSWAGQLRTVQCVRNWLGKDGYRREPLVRSPTELNTEVDALLDYQGGLDDYHRSDSWREAVVEHFRWNLQQMVEICEAAHVPIVLVNPVSNLLDCPPIKIEESPDHSSEQLKEFEAHWQQAQRTSSAAEATKAVKEALHIDPEHAGANFLLGKLTYAANDFEAALVFLTEAKDVDVCPLRATSAINQAVKKVAEENSVALVDAARLLSELSPHGIVGDNWLVDHVHPSVAGHQQLGREIAKCCIRERIFEVTEPEWEAGISRAFQNTLSALGEEYFQRGKQRLAGLLLWAQGRAKNVRSAAE